MVDPLRRARSSASATSQADPDEDRDLYVHPISIFNQGGTHA
jgi:hypothetical protein